MDFSISSFMFTNCWYKHWLLSRAWARANHYWKWGVAVWRLESGEDCWSQTQVTGQQGGQKGCVWVLHTWTCATFVYNSHIPAKVEMSLGLKEHDEFVKTACHYYMASSHMNCVKKFYIKKCTIYYCQISSHFYWHVIWLIDSSILSFNAVVWKKFLLVQLLKVFFLEKKIWLFKGL